MTTDFAWTTEPQRVREALAGKDWTRPIGMLNLIKFRKHAHYPPDSNEAPCSGEEAYSRYVKFVGPLLEALGARIEYSGICDMQGRPDEWDRAFLVRYQRASDLLELAGNPEYHKIAHHRTAAIGDTKLIMMEPDASAFA